MITKELLQKNIDYKLNNMEKLHYLSMPTPMFKNGKFDEDNWNGGDDLIRQFLYEIEDEDITYKDSNDNIQIKVIYKINYETHYVSIIVTQQSYEDRYFFSWYKHRGRTEQAIKNRKILLEKDYIELLNIIENVVKFKFKFAWE